MTGSARVRLLAVTGLVPALLVAGCSTDIAGEPAPRASRPSAQVAPTAPGPRPQRPPSGGCRVTATSDGSISSSGSGGRTETTNGRTAFSCGSGPLIVIESIEDDRVTFSSDGASVSLAPGGEGVVGAYRITVTDIDGGAARFQVTPAG